MNKDSQENSGSRNSKIRGAGRTYEGCKAAGETVEAAAAEKTKQEQQEQQDKQAQQGIQS